MQPIAADPREISRRDHDPPNPTTSATPLQGLRFPVACRGSGRIWPGLTSKLGHKPDRDCVGAIPCGINQSGDLADEPGLAPWRQNTRHVIGLTMPPGLPHQPLAMRLWLSRRSGRADGTDSAGHSSGRSMSIGSLEHMMRNRFRMFLRHTWLVTILGTIVLGGVVWAAFYYSTRNTVMRIATGPDGAKIVQVLANTLAKSHDRLQLQVVATDSANAGEEALRNGSADLAIVPTDDRQIAGLAGGRHPAAERDRADRAGAGAHSRLQPPLPHRRPPRRARPLRRPRPPSRQSQRRRRRPPNRRRPPRPPKTRIATATTTIPVTTAPRTTATSSK